MTFHNEMAKKQLSPTDLLTIFYHHLQFARVALAINTLRLRDANKCKITKIL